IRPGRRTCGHAGPHDRRTAPERSDRAARSVAAGQGHPAVRSAGRLPAPQGAHRGRRPDGALMAFEARPMFADPVDSWRRWFAWRPVKTANYGWVWLRTVEWRPCVMHSYLNFGAGDVFWQYRA